MKKLIDLLSILRKINHSERFFFFPFFHIGGAEKVHLNILEILQDNPNCFITEKSVGNAHLKSFRKYSNLLDISMFSRHKFFKKILLKRISKKINSCSVPVVFGSNSHFFYDLLPYLNSHVKKIDLLHAFSYEEPYASEKYSLNVVDLIDIRVVLGQKTKDNYKNLYAENNMDEKLIEKVVIIKNYIEIPDLKTVKKQNSNLKILYVGRDSYEKRATLFFQIAEKLKEENSKKEFSVVGDFDEAKYGNPTNIKFYGEVLDKKQLWKIYNESDIILITSYREGLPMVLLEGMSFGVVPISTNVGEIPELITNENKVGFLVDSTENDEQMVESFVEKIVIFDKDKKILEEFSKNAYNYVKENYDKKEFEKKYLKILSNEF